MREIELLQSRLDGYRCSGAEEEYNALREILQEVVLAGLSRTGFFERAAFHGGTQLRIFEGVRRFSEDLDFALVAPDSSFRLAPYLEGAASELASVGVEMEVRDRSKASAAVKKGFLKNDSLVRILDLRFVGRRGSSGTPPTILIKLEVDANPPAGATYSADQLLFPFPASVRNFDRSSSFAGKTHALLCRPYVKGRDWFDFVWYVSMSVRLNHAFLSAALAQQGPWTGKGVETDDAWVRAKLLETIGRIDWSAARRDILPFVHEVDRPSIGLWSAEFFASLVDRAFGHSSAVPAPPSSGGGIARFRDKRHPKTRHTKGSE